MLALGIATILLVVFGVLMRAGIALGGAYALTTLVSLPGVLPTLVWAAAGGYALLSVLGGFVAIAALASAGSTRRRFR